MMELVRVAAPWTMVSICSVAVIVLVCERLGRRLGRIGRELRSAKRELEEMASFNVRLLNGMQHGFAMLDMGGRRTLAANQYLADLFGTDIENLLHEGLERHLGEDYGEFLWEASSREEIGKPRVFHFVPGLLRAGECQFLEINRIDFEEDGRVLRYLFIEDVSELKRNQEQGAWLLWNQGELIKQLQCLLEISNLALDVTPPLEETVRKIVELVPGGLQCPEIACARIRFEGNELSWPEFKDTEWKLSSTFEYASGRIGTIEVRYLEQLPDSDVGVFSNQERDLVEALGRQIGGLIDRWRMDRDLKARYRLLDGAHSMDQKEFSTAMLEELSNLVGCSDGFFHLENPLDDTKCKTVWMTRGCPPNHPTEGLNGIDLTKSWHEMRSRRNAVVSNGDFILPRRQDAPADSIGRGVLLLPLERNGSPFAVIGLLGKPCGFDEHDVLQTRSFATVAMAIVERKIAEDKSVRLQRYLTNVIDSMPSTLIGVDPNGIVTQWNRKAQEATGIAAAGAVGRKLASVFGRLGDEADRINTAIRKREVQVDPKRHCRHESETRFEDVMIFPICEDESAGAVIRLDDITERVRMEELMLQSEKMLSLGGLAAGMAHEINNPLGGIIQTANVVAERIGNPALPANIKAAAQAGTTMDAIRAFMEIRNIPEMLDRIVKTGGRAAEIVRNMLDFARKSERQFSSHDLTELLDRCVALASSDYDLRKQIDFRQIEIAREYGNDVPPVPCESGKMQQVFLNILRNGAEAMLTCAKGQNEQPRFTLRSSFVASSRMVRIEIEDNGPGMDPEICKRVFEPFFTTKGPKDGTGLGLSVSYFIVSEIHHGRLEVASQPGQGTSFSISIPIEGRSP